MLIPLAEFDITDDNLWLRIDRRHCHLLLVTTDGVWIGE
jgi:hypothetical protein